VITNIGKSLAPECKVGKKTCKKPPKWYKQWVYSMLC